MVWFTLRIKQLFFCKTIYFFGGPFSFALLQEYKRWEIKTHRTKHKIKFLINVNILAVEAFTLQLLNGFTNFYQTCQRTLAHMYFTFNTKLTILKSIRSGATDRNRTGHRREDRSKRQTYNSRLFRVTTYYTTHKKTKSNRPRIARPKTPHHSYLGEDKLIKRRTRGRQRRDARYVNRTSPLVQSAREVAYILHVIVE